MNNSITGWSWEKPTESGLYLACRGDVETLDNIEPFRLVEGPSYSGGLFDHYSAGDVAKWHGSYKFARLLVGSEVEA